MIGHAGPAPLSALLLDLCEAFAHPAAHGAAVEFPADLTALWAEALREAADQARTLESTVVALTVQRDAGIERIGAMAYALDQMKARLPSQYHVPAPPANGWNCKCRVELPSQYHVPAPPAAASNVIDLSEQFRREQAQRRRAAAVDCQGDGA